MPESNFSLFTIEEKLYEANRISPRPEFLSELRAHLAEAPLHPISSQKSIQSFFHKPAWVSVVVIILIVATVLVAIGPQRVVAAFQQLFRYIPGVGIVDTSATVRVLAEPVIATREGISITVTSATLSADKTQLEYRIFGLPPSAYPEREDVMGCLQSEYLRLPDGSQIKRLENDFEPVPTDAKEATFVIPCIFNTLPGTAPENWEIPLRFVTAGEDLPVMSVIDLLPSPDTNTEVDATETLDTDSVPPAVEEHRAVWVEKEIETEAGYILIGQFKPLEYSLEQIIQIGAAQIHDASGKMVSYSHPTDIPSTGPNGWAFQFNAAGLTYPLTIAFNGAPLTSAESNEPNDTTSFIFDTGPSPQPGQEWKFNQDLQIAGHTLKLISITSDSRNGYSFRFLGGGIYKVDIEIEGHTAIGFGEGHGMDPFEGDFQIKRSYMQLPSGVLNVRLNNPILVGDPIRWEGSWVPASPRTDLLSNPTSLPGLCLTAGNLVQLSPVPPGLSGKVLLYENLDGMGQWGLAVHTLDSSQGQVLAQDAIQGALSADGTRAAYLSEDGIHIVDLDSQIEQVLHDITGYNLHWSSDGKQLAYTSAGGKNGIFIVNIDDGMVLQVSERGSELVAGWSPEGDRLYFVAPFTGGAAWNVYTFELATLQTRELFTIENGTPKGLNPSLSPDGKWIAYRGRDSSSVYLVHPDGSDTHLLIDNAGAARIKWSRSGWLGVSLSGAYTEEGTILLIRPDTCETYVVPGIHGNLEDLFIH